MDVKVDVWTFPKIIDRWKFLVMVNLDFWVVIDFFPRFSYPFR